MKIAVLLTLSCSLLLSCQEKTKTLNKDGVFTASSMTISRDTINSILQKAIETDTLEVYNAEPFVFFKAGKILSEKKKNALLISIHQDSLLKVELYTKKSREWIKNDYVTVEAYLMQFYTKIEDYNFDGINDIYIQATASNGYSISKGNLITVDPETYKLTLHSEAKELGNMRPHPEQNVVISEEYIDCLTEILPCILTHKWKENKLTFIKKECPCNN